WNRLAAQLIVNNNAKIAVVNTAEFEAFSEEVRAGLIKHMEKYTNSEAIFVLYGSNTNLYVLGPKSTFNSHLVVVANKHVWNPAGLAKFQLQAMIDPTGLIEKIPRPPNAFLLYRKDKQNSLKADYPNMHNNEISIITGSMWKEERPEVRAKYNDRALAIKAHFVELFPAYRYSPRKAYEIKKRAPRSKKLQI
ncbi:high mobility group box domain-containing protein, partial [Diplogelasinospora grovesii]